MVIKRVSLCRSTGSGGKRNLASGVQGLPGTASGTLRQLAEFGRCLLGGVRNPTLGTNLETRRSNDDAHLSLSSFLQETGELSFTPYKRVSTWNQSELSANSHSRADMVDGESASLVVALPHQPQQ